MKVRLHPRILRKRWWTHTARADALDAIMYWPIGVPKAFALTKHSRPKSRISNDGATAQNLGTDGNLVLVKHEREESRDAKAQEEAIVAMKVSRSGSIFATITHSSLTVWQTKPTVALAVVHRSPQSIKAYGPSSGLIFRPDGAVVVIQTQLGFLITYSLVTESNARVYQLQLPSSHRPIRNNSVDSYTDYRTPSTVTAEATPAGADGLREITPQFRAVTRIDAGISVADGSSDELIVATRNPASLQCIPWASTKGRPQNQTEPLSRMPWMGRDAVVTDIVYDRPMNLSSWITNDGKAYAVQRCNKAALEDIDGHRRLFHGFCYHKAETSNDHAIKVAIDARFSLIAVGCADTTISVYLVKDYAGNVPLSHKLHSAVSSTTCGEVQFLNYSPDGYCLFAGYQRGWAMWSVYGKLLATSFGNDQSQSETQREGYLHGVKDGFWLGGGCEIAMIGEGDGGIWIMEMARSAATGCLSPSNVSRSLLHSSSTLSFYRGHGIPDLTALSSDLSLWQTVQLPASYLVKQWPVKSAAISDDSRYAAIAGRRGLALYSTTRGRWRTLDDQQSDQEFTVRGGMCWHQHFLIACVEANGRYQVRIYSREKPQEASRAIHVEDLASPAVLTTTSGDDSLLVYTYANMLLHYVIVPHGKSIRLVQVGQIGFHGIIRAPPRVRAMSWILPEQQLLHGDPSQDVATASILFLVDGKLVLLLPSVNDEGELKYDMRVIAQNVEYYLFLRDQPSMSDFLRSQGPSGAAANGFTLENHVDHSLRDSLWYFDGHAFNVWSDTHDVLACAPVDLDREIPTPVRIAVDFYPISVMVDKGIIHGLDAELVQRRDVDFSVHRQSVRTQLFLPQLLRHHLTEYNSSAALHLADSYKHLPYFAHALEVLLHDVLDAEVDNPPEASETALLPTVLSFLSSFPAYLDIIVNCTRKTELRSWRTLFRHLPPVPELFEQALTQGKLKTAAGYLLVLHTFEQSSFQTHEFGRLIQRATAEQDWDLCGELARFLVGIDETGETLHAALAEAGCVRASNGGFRAPHSTGTAIDAATMATTEETRRPAEISTTNGAQHGSLSDNPSSSLPG